MKAILFAVFLIPNLVFADSYDTCKVFAESKEITNNSVQKPYNLVCHLFTNRKNKFWFGGKTDASTFTIVTPNILIGAYHAIMQLASRIKSIDIEIYQHEENGKEVSIKTVHVDKENFELIIPFTGGGNENDCGLIVLKSPLWDTNTIYPKMISYENAKKLSQYFYLSGYPHDADVPNYNGQKLWERKIQFASTFATNNGKLLHYPCVKTAVGDSGGPLWFIEKDCMFLLGTHVGGRGIDYNDLWGECFTDNKIEILNRILKEHTK